MYIYINIYIHTYYVIYKIIIYIYIYIYICNTLFIIPILPNTNTYLHGSHLTHALLIAYYILFIPLIYIKHS